MTVLSLILFGLLLIVAEVIFVPGTTVVGLIGFAFLIAGIAFGFKYYGNETGWTIVGVASVASGLLFYFAFKANVWGRFSLKSTNTGRVNEGVNDLLQPGLEGVALSALRPVGKAELNSQVLEVRTMGNYIDSGTRVRIVKILSNQIFVEPIN